jgi:hypothetical protein
MINFAAVTLSREFVGGAPKCLAGVAAITISLPTGAAQGRRRA